MTCRLSFPMLLLLLIGSCCWTAATADIQPEQVVAEITTESLTTDLPTTTILPTTTASFTTSTKTRISGPRRRISTVTPSATAVVRLETSTALPIEQPMTDQSRARILLGSEDDPNILSVSPIVPPTSNSNDWTPIVRPTTRLSSEASSVSAVQQSSSTSSSSSPTLLIRPTPLLRPLPTIVAAPARVGTQPSLRINNATTGRPVVRPTANSPATPSVVRFNIEDAGLPPNPNLADSAASPSAFPDDTIFFSPQFDDGNLTDNSAVPGAPDRANPAQSISTTAASSLAKLSGPFGNRIVRNRTTTLPPTTTTLPPPSTALPSGLSGKADEPLVEIGPSVLVTISPEEALEGNSTEVPTFPGDSTLTWTDDIPLVNEDRATELPSEPEMTTIIDLPSETSNAGSTTEATVSVTDPKTSIASIRTRPPRPTTTQQTTTTTGRRRRPLPTTEAATITAANSEPPAPLSSTELPVGTTTTSAVETTERDSARTLQTTTLAGQPGPITLFPAKTRPPSSTQNPTTTIKIKPAEEQPMPTIGWQTIPTTTKFSNVPAVVSHSSTTPGVHDVSQHQTVHPLTSFTDPLTTIRVPSTFMPPSTTTDHSFPLGSSDWPSTEGSSTLGEKDSTTIIAVSVSIAVVLCIALLLLLFIVLRRRRARAVQGTCQPARMDAYSLDNVSQTNTWQRNKGRSTLRSSKRSYLNQGFDDSTIFSVPLTAAQLALYMEKAITSIEAEFRNVATTSTVRLEELPPGVEAKNRYANVLPIPETRVHIRVQDNQPQDTPEQYINANYIKGPKDEPRYYIACQGPMEETVEDFWQMIWENQTKMIIQLTDLTENNVARCAEYLPPSEVLDCHRLYGDYQVTLKSRELRDNYVVSHVQLKRMEDNLVRDITHLWYSSWPATGVPEDAKTVVALLLEARKGQSKEQQQHPIVIHCSPGTGRTGAILAIDVCLRQLDTSRSIDIPRCVHKLRQDRSGCVQTGEQYAFIYRAVNYYASQLSNAALDSL